MFRRSSSDSSGGLPSADSSASEGFTVEVEVSDMPPTFGGQSAAASVPAALHDARAQLEQRLASLAARVHAAEAGEEGHQSLFGACACPDACACRQLHARFMRFMRFSVRRLLTGRG